MKGGYHNKYIYTYNFQDMVQILNYNEQFYLMTMDNSKFIDYKQFFKSFYKLPNSDNINRKHILYISYWMENMGLRIRYHMELAVIKKQL